MTGLNYSPFDPEQRLVVTDHEGAVVPVGDEIRPSPGTATVRPGGFGFEPGLWSPIHERADSVSSTLQAISRYSKVPKRGTHSFSSVLNRDFEASSVTDEERCPPTTSRFTCKSGVSLRADQPIVSNEMYRPVIPKNE